MYTFRKAGIATLTKIADFKPTIACPEEALFPLKKVFLLFSFDHYCFCLCATARCIGLYINEFHKFTGCLNLPAFFLQPQDGIPG